MDHFIWYYFASCDDDSSGARDTCVEISPGDTQSCGVTICNGSTQKGNSHLSLRRDRGFRVGDHITSNVEKVLPLRCVAIYDIFFFTPNVL